MPGSDDGAVSHHGSSGGGCGGPDIVVATPGRLVAHLHGTPGFSLADLQFLVSFAGRNAFSVAAPCVYNSGHVPACAPAVRAMRQPQGLVRFHRFAVVVLFLFRSVPRLGGKRTSDCPQTHFAACGNTWEI